MPTNEKIRLPNDAKGFLIEMGVYICNSENNMRYYLATEEIISACTDFKFPYFSTQYTEFIITTLLYHKIFIVIHVIILP